jgi:hypothetical protein
MAESSSNASVDIKPSDDKKSWEQIMQEEDQKKVEEKMKNLAVPKVDAKDEDCKNSFLHSCDCGEVSSDTSSLLPLYMRAPPHSNSLSLRFIQTSLQDRLTNCII